MKSLAEDLEKLSSRNHTKISVIQKQYDRVSSELKTLETEHNKFEMQKEMKLQDQIRLNNERRKVGVDMTVVQQAKNKLNRVEAEYKLAKQEFDEFFEPQSAANVNRLAILGTYAVSLIEDADDPHHLQNHHAHMVLTNIPSIFDLCNIYIYRCCW